jgi:hypothetical protein
MASRSADISGEAPSRRRKKGDETPDHPTAGHNSVQRAATIQSVRTNLRRLFGDKESVNDEIKEEKGRLKDLGINVREFMQAFRIAELEEDEQRSKVLDALKECLTAMDCGITVDWVEATGEEQTNKALEAATEREKKAPGYCAELGRKAFRDGEKQDTNPYPSGSKPHKLWNQGFAEEFAGVQKNGAAGAEQPSA